MEPFAPTGTPTPTLTPTPTEDLTWATDQETDQPLVDGDEIWEAFTMTEPGFYLSYQRGGTAHKCPRVGRLQVLFDDLPGNLVGYCYDAIYVGNGNFKPMGLDNARRGIPPSSPIPLPTARQRIECATRRHRTRSAGRLTRKRRCLRGGLSGVHRLAAVRECFPRQRAAATMGWPGTSAGRGWEATLYHPGRRGSSTGRKGHSTHRPPMPTLTPTPTPQECLAQPYPRSTDRRVVCINRNYPR